MVRLHFSVIFFLIFSPCLLFFTGCSSDPDPDDPSAVESSVVVDEVVHVPTAEDTFAELKALYPNDTLGEELETLRALTETRSYLDLLSHTYGEKKETFPTFVDFLAAAQPDPDRYLPYLEQFIDNPTEEDVSVLHRITQDIGAGNVLLHQLIVNNEFEPLDLFLILEKQLAWGSDKNIKAWFERRFAPDRNQDVLDNVNKEEAFERFSAGLPEFVLELQKADAARIQTLFDTHGENDGTIWLAIREPLLTGQILKDFTSKQLFLMTNKQFFLRWVAGDFFVEVP